MAQQTQPLIKICGMRDPELAQQAVAMGAHYIGLIFYAKSVRAIDIASAKKVADSTKKAGGIPVAVFVDADARDMQSICEQVGVTTVQLHGDQARLEHVQLPENYHRIYVLHVNDQGEIASDSGAGVESLIDGRDLLMYDHIVYGRGKHFDWQRLSHLHPFPYLLAGGLTADNVADAITTLKPYGVDVSSGVEIKPGVKSKALIQKFILNVQGVHYE